jgi:hypothetical protein
MRDRLTVYAPQGMLGYGYPTSSMEAALATRPDVLAVDAGSTDPGPYYLGAGVPFTSRRAVVRDLGRMLEAAHTHRLPLLIGSAGGGGARPHLDWTLDVYHELCRERGWRFRTAVIDAEIDRAWLKKHLAAGRVRPLDLEQPLTADDVDAAAHIVAQMGHAPFERAIEAGAQVVIAGRAYDPAMMGAHALREGFDPGLVVHMGKILECGAAAAYPRHGSDGLIGIVDRGGFTVEPPNPKQVCTVASVAAHSLYEKADPYLMHFPGGAIDLRATTFEQVTPRAVRVRGTRFVPAERYTLKLEGARRVGYRTIAIAGARDPLLLAHLDDYLANVRARVAETYPDGYRLLFHVYGRDGVMGALEPVTGVRGHEVGIVFEVIAGDPETSAAVLALTRSAALHVTYPGRKAIAGNLAFPFSPSDLRAGEVYEFGIHHLVEVDDPCEPFAMEVLE